MSVFRTQTTRNARARKILIASNPLFLIRRGHRATVAATLTQTGRALARRRKPIRATLALTSIDPVTARRTTHTQTVNLHAQ